jgi:hypothetical protein
MAGLRRARVTGLLHNIRMSQKGSTCLLVVWFSAMH